jgi:hypothetical protein
MILFLSRFQSPLPFRFKLNNNIIIKINQRFWITIYLFNLRINLNFSLTNNLIFKCIKLILLSLNHKLMK